jgi:hypothetical protein
MDCKSISEASRRGLRQLTEEARTRGDECLAVLLEGLEMYISLGREVELLELMRDFEREIRPAVDGTPSAEELERLYGSDQGAKPE